MKILFGVFDWGLGHATRDTPLIEELLKDKNEVHILSTGKPLKLLREYFKNRCKYHEVLSVYEIYNNTCTRLEVALNVLKLLKSLKIARKKSKEIIEKEKFDIVISDCRYDVYDKVDNSYLINHQLRFNLPFIVRDLLEIWLAKRMSKYKYVIVPDYENNNLTGILSHDLIYFPREKIKYIGILSHIKKIRVKQDIDYFISLSGPEKTRIELEKKILTDVKELKEKIVIAGGNPNIKEKSFSKNIKFYSFLDSKKQEEMMNQAKFIIIRGGYTTIMELSELNKKALLIPSPGQPEQEYIAKHLEKEKYFHHVPQSTLNLKKDIEKSKNFNGFSPIWKTHESVKKFMNIIKSK